MAATIEIIEDGSTVSIDIIDQIVSVDVSETGPQGPQGAAGNIGATGLQGPSGVIAVTSPITNTGSSTAATIGIDQTLLTISPSQVTGTAAILGANTFTGKQTLPASTTGAASLNLANGTAPASPATGDLWANSGSLIYQSSLGGQTLAFLSSNITGNAASITGNVTASQVTGTAVVQARTVNTDETTLTGGGNLSANRTLSIKASGVGTTQLATAAVTPAKTLAPSGTVAGVGSVFYYKNPLPKLKKGGFLTSSVSGSGATVTVNTSAAHGLSTDDFVFLTGGLDAGGNPVYQTAGKITVVTTTQFTFPSTATGTASSQPTWIGGTGDGTLSAFISSNPTSAAVSWWWIINHNMNRATTAFLIAASGGNLAVTKTWSLDNNWIVLNGSANSATTANALTAIVLG
jgi:hypothetical protein